MTEGQRPRPPDQNDPDQTPTPAEDNPDQLRLSDPNSPDETPGPAAGEPGETPTRLAWLTLITVSVSVFMVAMEITVIALALPEIQRAFPGTSESTLSWVASAYSLGVGALLLVAGWLADRHGRRRAFLVGLAAFIAGSVGSGAAAGMGMLIAARVVQSVGGALLFPAGLALTLAAFPRSRHQFAIGMWGAMGGLAAALGPSLGGLLIAGFGWRSVFLVNIPVAAAAMIVGRRILVESTGDMVARRVEAVSVPLASLGIGAILLGMLQGGDWGWGSAATLTAFGAGAALIAAFAVRSLRHPEPLFPLRLFRLRSWTVGNAGSFLFCTAFFSMMVLLPSFVQERWGWSVVQTGLAIAPGPFLSFAISPQAGKLADRIGNAPIVMAGAAAGAAGTVWYRFALGAEPALGHLLIGGLLIGASAGLCFAPLTGATLRDVPGGMYATGGAGRTTVFQTSSAVGIAVGFALLGRSDGPEAALAGYQRVWTLGVICYLGLLAVFALAYPRQTLSQAAREAAVRPGRLVP